MGYRSLLPVNPGLYGSASRRWASSGFDDKASELYDSRRAAAAGSHMTKTVTVNVRLMPAVNEKLEALARSQGCSKSDLASRAIESFVDVRAWQLREIERGLAEARSGKPGVPHEDVAAWVQSWDTDQELPRPKPKK